MCKTNTFPRPTVLLPLSVQREQSAERKQAEEAQVAERDKAAAEEKARVKQERRQVESVAEDSGDEDVHGNDCDVDDGDKKKGEFCWGVVISVEGGISSGRPGVVEIRPGFRIGVVRG